MKAESTKSKNCRVLPYTSHLANVTAVRNILHITAIVITILVGINNITPPHYSTLCFSNHPIIESSKPKRKKKSVVAAENILHVMAIIIITFIGTNNITPPYYSIFSPRAEFYDWVILYGK